jgi:AcrR family transcriptional regulator
MAPLERPAYTRLQVDERRRQLLDAGAALFAEHAYEEISMRDIARAAGVSKPLLYHYFPSKIDLFKAAVAEKAAELQRVIEPSGEGTPFEQLSATLEGYLAWIEANQVTWSKLVQSAAALPEARELVEGFRQRTMDMALARLTGDAAPRPALRTAIKGWLGYMDAAILDWTQTKDLAREQLRDLLIAAFGAALTSAQQLDPEIQFDLSGT